MPAMPIVDNDDFLEYGLSKREHFAGLAMQGMLCDSGLKLVHAKYAEYAVDMADALLKELDK